MNEIIIERFITFIVGITFGIIGTWMYRDYKNENPKKVEESPEEKIIDTISKELDSKVEDSNSDLEICETCQSEIGTNNDCSTCKTFAESKTANE